MNGSHVLVQDILALVLLVTEVTIVFEIDATLGLAQVSQQRLFPGVLLSAETATIRDRWFRLLPILTPCPVLTSVVIVVAFYV